MQINSKHPVSHHLTCLSGSSQSPLIGPNILSDMSTTNGMTSERSTPISLHSLQHFNTGNGSTGFANNNGFTAGSGLRSSQNSIPGTPLLPPPLPPPRSATPSSAGSHTKTLHSIFFPPILPARSGRQQMGFASNKSITASNSALLPNKSPTFVTDINSNAENERNRELSSSWSSKLNQQQVSPDNNKLLNTPTACRSSSSKLNSPALISSNTTISNSSSNSGCAHRNAFFPETHPNKSQFTHIQQPPLVRRSVNLTTEFNRASNGSPTNQSSATTTVLNGCNNSHHSIINLSSASIRATDVNKLNQHSRTIQTTDASHDIVKSSIAPNLWTQQEDNYHLYHEPIDLEEEQNQQQTIIQQKNHSHSSPQQHPIRPARSIALGQYSPDFRTQPVNSRVNTPRSADHIASISRLPSQPRQNQSCAIVSSKSSNDWSIGLPSNPLRNRSPINIDHQNHNEATSEFEASNHTSDGRNDVSADIYFCYVSMKSNERANHRSKSYHGPKNTTISRNQNFQASYSKDASKNLSSSSVVDLPVSNLLSSNMPIHLRDHCVRELVETESNYVHALEMIINSFSKPLEPLMKRDDHHAIFGHIKYFYQIHSSFQIELVKASYQFPNASPLSSPSAQSHNPGKAVTINGNSNHRISSCFLNFKERFLKYDEYCASLSKTQSLVDELVSRNEALAQQLERCQQDANDGRFKLRDLLSLPLQRILKYHILLLELVKNTSQKNEDYYGLRKAYECMVDIGQYINEVKRDTETAQIIHDIERSISGLNIPNTSLGDYGHLITDGFIKIKIPHDSKAKLPHDIKLKQKKYVFVFDKAILICKDTGYKKYQFKEALILNEFEIDVNPATALNDIAPRQSMKEKRRYSFNLVKLSDKTTYSFIAKSIEIKKRWVDSIQKAFDNIKPVACRTGETDHDFVMHTFERASSCDHCEKLLLGLYYQGYRCRVCSAGAHKKCLAQMRPCSLTMTPRPSNGSKTQSRAKCSTEPQSPSVRSNCSDETHNVFSHFPTSHSSSTPCVDVLSNEYSNLGSRLNAVNLSSSFRGMKSNGIEESPNDTDSKENHQFDVLNEDGSSYVNFILNEYPWFHGRMNRDQAQALLERSPHGTFLVRVSPKHNGSYVISLNYNSQVKHMRIYVKDNQLFLSQNRYFKSVIELVSWYEQNSLVESFHMLDARLAIPYKGLKNCD